MTGAQPIRIINFHGIGRPGRPLDTGEAPFWVSTEHFRRILDRIAAHPQRDRLAITFDDGNSSDVAIALPELLGRGLVASFFVLTGRLGHPGSLTAADVAALQAGGMAIGSHGVDHNDLTTLAPAALATELERSRAELEDICGTPVRSFAIPFGRYNRSVLQALFRSGYHLAYTSDGGPARAGEFVQPRRSIRSDMRNGQIERVLGGRMPPLQTLRRAIGMRLKQVT